MAATSPDLVALITGSSRGIGAETARQLGAAGLTVVVTYREKVRRADQVVADIVRAGGSAVALGADLTDAAGVSTMIEQVRSRFGRLDLLVLNASGGMEQGVAADYALRLNRDAQITLLDQADDLITRPGRVVLVTSHQAHFYPERAVPQVYVPVAASKRAGEDAVRQWVDQRPGLELAVVSGDMIEGTITVTLLERSAPGTMAGRLDQVGAIPTIEEFAAAIVEASVGPVPATTVYVGGADYLSDAG